MAYEELGFASIRELGERLGRGELSPRELARAFLARIEEINPAINAYLAVAGDQALAQAERARGPLAGIPLSVKDLFWTRGLRTTSGSKIFADFIPDRDATAVARLREQGAVILGKTNTHEFAYGVTTVNPHFGASRNPWDRDRIPGGSSGGSAAAVAAGLCAGSLGTDTGGSIRIPAALCGIVGLKPTYGRVSRFGITPLSWSMDHAGPMARSVEDVAILLEAIAGPDSEDATASPRPVPRYREALGGGVRGLRLGVPLNYFFERLDSEVESAVRRAIEDLQGLGASLIEVRFEKLPRYPGIASTIAVVEGAAYHDRFFRERPQDYGADVQESILMGKLILATDYVKAQQARQVIVNEFERIMGQVDVLLTPAVPAPASLIDAPTLSNGESFWDLLRLTEPFDTTGLPAISVPCGFTSSGLPIGLQIAGPAFAEETVLRVAHAYEQSHEWSRRRPRLGG